MLKHFYSRFLTGILPGLRRGDLKTASTPSGRALLLQLWDYRKYAMMTVYLLCMGFALGVIYIYAGDRPVEAAVPQAPEKVTAVEKVLPLPFEEGHQNTEVVVHLPQDLEVAPSFPRRQEVTPDRPPLWKANAVAVSGLMPGQPQISIVIDDLGLLKHNTLRLINMKPGLTLSFLPLRDRAHAPDRTGPRPGARADAAPAHAAAR